MRLRSLIKTILKEWETEFFRKLGFYVSFHLKETMRPVPESIKKLIRTEKIAFSRKARSVLFSGILTMDDLICSILNGSVIKRERDETRRAKFKYTIIGPA